MKKELQDSKLFYSATASVAFQSFWPMGILVKGNINTPMFELLSETQVKYTGSILQADR